MPKFLFFLIVVKMWATMYLETFTLLGSSLFLAKAGVEQPPPPIPTLIFYVRLTAGSP